ncbi:antitoxin [Novosphingobium sp. JCM 18896]|uniref:antitoxin n=1 Tax=Novosphingobium sp. JCM 18896 TaxID=2989731 RepID=UPI0022219FD4|nr:antitoxin [Novosphingobium sp. JCM 18896]MCW1432002.1 antitoxin [Novosphingobium sp. JCM 18896]
MAKPRTIGGYGAAVTEGCERVLVTLLRGLGPWKDSVFLIGGLAPRYIITARPPAVPQHAGTGDVDIVVDIAMLTDTKAYQTLENNLRAMGFDRAENDAGKKQSWRWKAQIDGRATMVIEFLADAPELSGGRVTELPTEGNVTAINIPHASMVFDLHDQVEITAELLNGGGRATEVVRFADIVSFTCLKAFAFDQRAEPKDAHDLVYCLEHYEGGQEALYGAFSAAMEGEHGAVIREALGRLAVRFSDANPDESYLRDGPTAVARFEDDDADVETEPEPRDRRILRQRRAADVMKEFLAALDQAESK